MKYRTHFSHVLIWMCMCCFLSKLLLWDFRNHWSQIVSIFFLFFHSRWRIKYVRPISVRNIFKCYFYDKVVIRGFLESLINNFINKLLWIGQLQRNVSCLTKDFIFQPYWQLFWWRHLEFSKSFIIPKFSYSNYCFSIQRGRHIEFWNMRVDDS